MVYQAVGRRVGEPVATVKVGDACPGTEQHRAIGGDGDTEDLVLHAAHLGAPEAPPFLRGDPNRDGYTDIADAVFTVSYLFADGPTPSCLDAADANDDGGVDSADAVAVLSHLFAGSGDFPEPFGECGVDLTADALGCRGYPPCEQ